MACDQTLDIKRIFKRIHLQWEEKCQQHSLGYQQRILYSKDGLSGENLHAKLIKVLCDYANDLVKLISKENHFEK